MPTVIAITGKALSMTLQLLQRIDILAAEMRMGLCSPYVAYLAVLTTMLDKRIQILEHLQQATTTVRDIAFTGEQQKRKKRTTRKVPTIGLAR
jgi:hypothetical protein